MIKFESILLKKQNRKPMSICLFGENKNEFENKYIKCKGTLGTVLGEKDTKTNKGHL